MAAIRASRVMSSPALAASAPERGACFKAVEALQANLKKMPVAVLTDAEKAQFDHLSAAWTAFLDIDAKATQAYGGGSEGRAAGDALLSKDAANTFNRAVTAAAGLNGAIARYAAQAGLATPVNATITALIKALETQHA